jgi:hypothetical protein
MKNIVELCGPGLEQDVTTKTQTQRGEAATKWASVVPSS